MSAGKVQASLCTLLWLGVAGCGGDSIQPGDRDGSVSGDAMGDGAAASSCIYPEIDAGGSQPCWIDGLEEGGISVELGTGEDVYMAMPDELPLVCGSQQGFHIVVRSKAEGIEPGDPRNILCPSNPRTRFRAYFADNGQPIGTETQCGIRTSYIENEDGELILQRHSDVLFALHYQDDVFGRDVRVVAEVIDYTGKYAKDEKIITVVEPTNWADAGPVVTGCGGT